MFMLKLTDSLIGSVTGGAVIGLDGGIWATTPGFYGNPLEFAAIAMAFTPGSDAPYHGIVFQNELYVVTSMSDSVIVEEQSQPGCSQVQQMRCGWIP